MLTPKEIKAAKELFRAQFEAELSDLFDALDIPEMLESDQTIEHIETLVENRIEILKSLEGLKSE